MRNLKIAALVSSLLLGTAFAATSTPTDFDTATVSGESATVGTFGEAVNFTVSTSSIDLTVMKPGETYTITIPVTNTTDRAINLTLKNVLASAGDSSVASIVSSTQATPLQLAAGASGELIIAVTLKGAGDVVAGDTVTISYDVEGTADY